MRGHLESHHEIIVPKDLSKNQEKVQHQLTQLYGQAQAEGTTEEFDNQILADSINLKVLIKALITLIIVRNLSFILVKWLEFHVLC